MDSMTFTQRANLLVPKIPEKTGAGSLHLSKDAMPEKALQAPHISASMQLGQTSV